MDFQAQTFSCSLALSLSLSLTQPLPLLFLKNQTKNQTKAGLNRAIDWLKDDREIAETKLMAARPPPALLKKYQPATDAADAAVNGAAGTSVSVPGGATVQHTKEKAGGGGAGGASKSSKELAVASSVDVTSGAELAAALSAGEDEVQAVADALIAVVAEQAPAAAPKGPGKSNVTVSLVNEPVADAVTELLLTTREGSASASAAAAEGEGTSKKPSLSRLESLGVAFGAAMREAALGAEVTPKQHAPGAKPLTASPLAIAESFVAGIQGAAVPCAAGIEGPGAKRNTSAWYGAAAKTCCGPVALSAVRAAQAAVNGGPDSARVALYSALSRSVDLGGPGSFSLARCSPPNAKE